jgi:EAL domain-containing protein (putative c-di-GMP-specific phosphodiesterase class I)
LPQGRQRSAEGIETPEQLEFLKAHNCDRGQDCLFSRPLPAAEATTMLAAFGARSAAYRGRTKKKNASA